MHEFEVSEREVRLDEYCDMARKAAPEYCKECNELSFTVVDHIEGFDLEPVLRGHHNIKVNPYCNYLMDDCNPAKCIRRKLELLLTNDDNFLINKFFPSFIIKKLKELV
jgi:hypothetical protein